MCELTFKRQIKAENKRLNVMLNLLFPSYENNIFLLLVNSFFSLSKSTIDVCKILYKSSRKELSIDVWVVGLQRCMSNKRCDLEIFVQSIHIKISSSFSFFSYFKKPV